MGATSSVQPQPEHLANMKEALDPPVFQNSLVHVSSSSSSAPISPDKPPELHTNLGTSEDKNPSPNSETEHNSIPKPDENLIDSPHRNLRLVGREIEVTNHASTNVKIEEVAPLTDRFQFPMRDGDLKNLPNTPIQSENDTKLETSNISMLPPALKRYLKLSPTNRNDPLFVISTDHILGYMETLEAAKFWIDEEISKQNHSFSSNYDIERREHDLKDNLVYNVTVYEEQINRLMSRRVITFQYNVWKISCLLENVKSPEPSKAEEQY